MTAEVHDLAARRVRKQLYPDEYRMQHALAFREKRRTVEPVQRLCDGDQADAVVCKGRGLGGLYRDIHIGYVCLLRPMLLDLRGAGIGSEHMGETSSQS